MREVAAERASASRGPTKKFYQSFMASAALDDRKQPAGRRPAPPRDRRRKTSAAGPTAADLKLLRHQLNFTATSGDEALVTRLLDRSPALANAKFSDRSRPLHHAAMWGYDGIITQLIALGADVNARDRTAKTPLHWAAVNGHRRACELLLAAGADAAALDGQGQSPLAAADAFVPEHAVRVRAVLKKARSAR